MIFCKGGGGVVNPTPLLPLAPLVVIYCHTNEEIRREIQESSLAKAGAATVFFKGDLLYIYL